MFSRVPTVLGIARVSGLGHGLARQRAPQTCKHACISRGSESGPNMLYQPRHSMDVGSSMGNKTWGFWPKPHNAVAFKVWHGFVLLS